MASSRILLPALGLAAAGVAALASRAVLRPSAGPGKAAGSLNDRLRQEALALLPNKDSVLGLPDPTWDHVLGGRKGDYLGAPAWRYYSTYAGENADGSKRKGGTTCGLFGAFCAARAGFPVDMINRAPDDEWAPGSGFTIGAHIAKFREAAQKKGWLVNFKPGAAIAGIGAADTSQLLPGDYYCQFRDLVYNGQKVDGSHVGVVLAVSEPGAGGVRTITTGDGGQTRIRDGKEEQCATWNTRTLYPDGRIVNRGTEAKLVWVVRAA